MKKSKKILLISSGALFLFVAGVGLWIAVMASRDAYEEARRMGIPLEPEDIYSTPAPDPADNAAPLIIQAEEELDRAGVTLGSLNTDIASDVEAERRRAEAELAKAANVMPLIKQAASKPACRFERDWADGVNMYFPQWGQCRKVLAVVRAEAVASSRAGQSDAALDGLEYSFRLAAFSGSDPLLVALVGQLRTDQNVAETSAVIAAHLTTREDLARLKKIVQEQQPSPRIADYLAGESVLNAALARSLSTADFIQLSRGDLHGLAPSISVRSGPPSAMPVRAQFNRYLDLLKPIYSIPEAERDNETILPLLNQINTLPCDAPHPANTLPCLFFPSFASLETVIKRRNACMVLAVAYADLLAHRLETGDFPDSLDSLPDTYIDPFTGSPLGYRREGEGFRVWSVGIDGDQGGKTSQELKQSEKDEMFIYPWRFL